MNWELITSTKDIQPIIRNSDKPVLIFKHSSRCMISVMVKRRLEDHLDELKGISIYQVNVLENRDVSNHLEEVTGINHESPQALGFLNGKLQYHASHNAVLADSIKEALVN